jgi:hypothetical protein
MTKNLALILLATAACTSSNKTSVQAPVASSKAGAEMVVQVKDAQRSWCDALLSITAASREGRDAKALATQVLETAYDYGRGPVLFKPTLTHGEQTFRMTERGALAYFVGGDATYPNDTGFARKDWVACEPTIVETVTLSPDAALAMGNVTLTDGSGTRVTVDKTFGYRRDEGGKLRIVLHHSSLPYTPPSASQVSSQGK